MASADDPPPEVEVRAGTRAPAEVRGLSEPAGPATPSRRPGRTWPIPATTSIPPTSPRCGPSPTAGTRRSGSPSATATYPSVTIGRWPDGGTPANSTLAKVFQVPVTGGPLRRYSCNGGMQDYFAPGEAGTLVWLDGTTGTTGLVTRDRAAVRC
ncbi:hypothetical protein ACWEPC_31745 [Nonomuraea sp. NPDC004297]